MNRRSFLRFLGIAPVAATGATVAAVAPRPPNPFGKFGSWPVYPGGESGPEIVNLPRGVEVIPSDIRKYRVIADEIHELSSDGKAFFDRMISCSASAERTAKKIEMMSTSTNTSRAKT